MANAMKKTAKTPTPSAKSTKPAVKPASKSTPVTRSVPKKATAPKPTGKAAATAVKAATSPAKAALAASAKKTSAKPAPKAVRAAAPDVAKVVTKAAVTPTKKNLSQANVKTASVQSKASVTTKKPEPKTAKPAAKAVKSEAKDVSVMIAPGVSQTTDAAALAAIDTSGYILPSVKVPGRRGRKPKEFQPENDEIAALNAVERAELKAVDKAKAKDRKAKEKALLKDAFSSDTEASEEELERRRQKLKTLIKQGKERGYLTFSEINDHLPENIVDPEAIEGIIGTFNDMGISVYEHAPDAETLLLSDNVANVASDDDAEAAAEAALSTVDSDFGRTTDPVRMYMREMGSVELLTREGEIEIAKRIEDGLKDMIQAISACPTTIAEILVAADRIKNDEIKVDEIVDGLVDMSEGEVVVAAAASDEEEEDEEDEEEEEEEEEESNASGAAAGFSAEQLEQLK